MNLLASGYAKVFLAMLIWGSVGIFVRLAEQPAHVIVFTRVLVAFAALFFYIRLRKIPIDLRGYWQTALFSGAAIALNWLFFFKSIQATTIGNAVLTYYTSPIFAILWARLFLGERLERRALYALLLSAGGILLMLSGYEFSLSSRDFTGIIYGLTGAVFYSTLAVAAKTMPALAGETLALVQMGVSVLMFLPSVLADPPFWTARSLLLMATLGILHTALALVLYFNGLKSVKVQHASVLSYIDPVSALVYAYAVYAEVPAFFTALGGFLILTASCLVIRRPNAAVSA